MKLDKKDVVLRRIKLDGGLRHRIHLATPTLATTLEPQIFRKEFDATVICTGATQPRDLPIEGRSLEGCCALRDGSSAPPTPRPAPQLAAPSTHPIHAKDKDVIVIAGGAHGTDCVGTSMRHGCKSIVQIEILPSPRSNARPTTPCPAAARPRRWNDGRESCAAKFGADRRVYCTTVKKFIGDANGNVQSLVTVEIKWEKNEKGQFIRRSSPAPRKPARATRVARHGLPRPEQALLKEIGLETHARSNIKAEHENTRPASRRLRRRRLPPRSVPRGWAINSRLAARRVNATAT